MKFSQFPSLVFFFAGITLLTLKTPAARAQGTTSLGTSTENVLGQLSAAFSGGKSVQSVQFSGEATWHGGSLEDSGAVTLTASADGSSQMQLLLGGSGQRTETQAGAGSSARCNWAGEDGTAHEVHSGSCWRPVLWFLPALSLQTSLPPSNLSVVDLGMETVGASANINRHLQSQITFSDSSDALAAEMAQQSKTDIGLDPTSHLPAMLAYSVHPDNGASAQIAIEVHYSDYRTVNGVQIPYLIQRYVNGALQLEIHINSAEIN